MSTPESGPCRGEIWLVNFDPTIGAEIRKTRPGVIVSSDALGLLPLRVTIPITAWRDAFQGNPWHVPLAAGKTSGLRKDSAADVLQIKSLDVRRFMHRLGTVDDCAMREILLALMAVVEFVE